MRALLVRCSYLLADVRRAISRLRAAWADGYARRERRRHDKAKASASELLRRGR